MEFKDKLNNLVLIFQFRPIPIKKENLTTENVTKQSPIFFSKVLMCMSDSFTHAVHMLNI